MKSRPPRLCRGLLPLVLTAACATAPDLPPAAIDHPASPAAPAAPLPAGSSTLTMPERTAPGTDGSNGPARRTDEPKGP